MTTKSRRKKERKMVAKKRTAALLFAVIAGCTALALLTGPAFADAERGKSQGKAQNQGASASSEDAGTSSETGPGKSQGKSQTKGQAKGSGSQSSGTSENSANSPAPEGSTTGQPAQGCDQADAGYEHNYASTCDGSPSLNGNGGGKATGKPCAGCVGAADNKNPKGQFPDGSDANNGYECDGNNGIGKSNPAHTGCQPSTSTPPPPECPEGTTLVGDECVPDDVLPEVLCPDGSEMVDGVCMQPDGSIPDVVEDTTIERDERARVLGAVLPFTGASLLNLLGLGIGLMGAGTLTIAGRRRRR